MNKSESKYFSTAARMDKAFLELLGKKDFAYITIKEICETAGVNRSTFYLHYETMTDLLSESVSYVNKDFLTYIENHLECSPERFVEGIKDYPDDELYLITPEYLMPYLDYIKEHKRLFCALVENAAVLRLDKSYERMFCHVFMPILDRYNVPEHDRQYIMAFHMQGLMAIIAEWLKNDCNESTEYISYLIQRCVKRCRTKQ